MSVAENLDLDVFWIVDKFFDVNSRICEIVLTFRAASTERAFKLIHFSNNTHPFTTTAGRSLDDDR
ncbi:hypothetical protein D3C87_1623210 [compost metagenome]